MENYDISLQRFFIIYILLLIMLFIMKKAKLKHSYTVFISSFRMSLQLFLAGMILTYILKNPHPIFTILYIIVMILFATNRVIKKNSGLNKKFKWSVFFGIAFSGVLLLCFFVMIIIKKSIFNPRFAIPIGGMILGNAMNGTALGVKTFREYIASESKRIETLINFGAHPREILLPFINRALETAILPTLNSMAGMGIVVLPGMMTGQIISGTNPNTAILYQISIMVALATVIMMSVFITLTLGARSLYDDSMNIKLD